MVTTGATFADAAAEFMCYAERDRAPKPSTLRGCRSIVRAYLLPAFGERRLEDITTAEVERWRAQLVGVERELSSSSKNRILVLLHGVLGRACKVWRLPLNPASRVERHAVRVPGDIEVFSPEEVWALVRAASNEQDAALFLTAAFTGMRPGELLALRWRDVDFAGCIVTSARASQAARSPLRSQARCAPCRSRPGSVRRSRGFRSASSSPGRTTSSSRVSPVSMWTAPRSGAATSRPLVGPDYGRCASTTSGTRSARA